MTPSKASHADPSAHKRVLSILLFPLALFPLAALLTYDWRSNPALCMPPEQTTNWIGALGDRFAAFTYQLFGVAAWAIPIVCAFAALAHITGRSVRRFRRIAWFSVFLVALSCLMEVLGAHAGFVAHFAERVNIADPGGAIGYLAMTRLLAPLISDFGASVLVTLVMLGSFVGVLGVENIADFFSAVVRWAGLGKYAAVERAAASNSPDAEKGLDEEQQRLLAALRVKEAAKREAQEEKERIRAEKAAARNAAREERERIRAEKLAERERKRAEQEREREEREAAAARLRAAPPPPPEPPPVPRVRAAQQPAKTAAVNMQKPAPKEMDEPPAPEDKGPYILPPVSVLNPLKASSADHSDVGEMSKRLIDTLKIFNVDAALSYTVPGPVVTKYAIELAPGTRYSAVTNISSELMGALRAKSIRIEAPIPGEDRVGIEVPNKRPAGITFREIFESDTWKHTRAELPLLFGKDAAGKELVADLASMPHMLVAGATGQGKSVCLNSLINGLLMTRTPEQLKLIMVDPKCVEFTPYTSIPHLLVPVITDNRKVVFSLHWAVAEMEKRLHLFSNAHVKNIYDFNHRKSVTQTDMFGNDEQMEADMPRTVPYIVIIIDEAADLIGQCGKDVTPDIQRITQKARAAGIHLILATQRPDAKIITGTIKANIPGRVAFKTSQAVDSRTILDESGAENLIGKGDMLFRGKDGLLTRAQGAWISDEEITRVTEFIGQHSTTQFDEKFAKNLIRVKEAAVTDPFAALDDEEKKTPEQAKADAAEARERVKADENASDFKKAVECIINTNRASTSHFQRKLGWGYNHSAKIMDMLEDAGVIGPLNGAGSRPIIMDQDQLLAIFNGSADAAESADGSFAKTDEGGFDDITETSDNEENIA